MTPPETGSGKQKAKKTRYRYNQKNQLLQKEDADGISCFTYDRQGGIIEEKTAAGIRRFTYNSLHQQTQVETETGNIQKNRYDAEGLRYELIENGRRTSFVYHNGELLHEKGGEAGLSKEATSYHLGAGIEAFQRDRKTFYYHQDEQLNTALISDEKAGIIISMMPLVQDWKQQKHYPTESATQASSMTSRQGSIICERDTIIRYLAGLCRRMCIRGMD